MHDLKNSRRKTKCKAPVSKYNHINICTNNRCTHTHPNTLFTLTEQSVSNKIHISTNVLRLHPSYILERRSGWKLLWFVMQFESLLQFVLHQVFTGTVCQDLAVGPVLSLTTLHCIKEMFWFKQHLRSITSMMLCEISRNDRSISVILQINPWCCKERLVQHSCTMHPII